MENEAYAWIRLGSGIKESTNSVGTTPVDHGSTHYKHVESLFRLWLAYINILKYCLAKKNYNIIILKIGI